jgi:uncharacterized protein YbbK (DUF523 family)
LKQRVLISACLAGLQTRYDGTSDPYPGLQDLLKEHLVIPVCPEILGGLGIPRSPCRFIGGDGKDVLEGQARIIDRDDIDRTSSFIKGAHETVRIVEIVSPDVVYFNEGSPSCGMNGVNIDGLKQRGCGVTTALLMRRNIPIVAVDNK